MSLKRLRISIAAAALLAIGVAACGGGDTKTVTVHAPAGGSGTPASGTQTRQDGEDHRQRAADRPRLARRHLQERQGARPSSTTTSTSSCSQAADADSQAQQIEQAIAREARRAGGPAAGRRGADAGRPEGRAGRASRSSTSTACSPTPDAATATILGDNYQIGVLAADYIADQLKCNGNVVEIQGLAGISVTEDRSKGFTDELKKKCPDGGIKIVAQQPGDFNPDTGLKVMENILQAQKKIDAVYTHDDDMAQGVVQAIRNAGREDEMFLTGVGGSQDAMEQIKEGGLYRATFLYNPNMAASAVNMARLIALGEGFPELVPPEVPRQIVVPAAVVTKDNVDKYEQYAFN